MTRTRKSWQVVCFSGVDFDSHWQRPQALMSELAERGATVIYVDNLGLRFPRLADRKRVARRLRAWAGRRAPGHQSSRVTTTSPVVLPLQRFAPVRVLARRTLLHCLRRRLSSQRPLIVWTYSPLPVIGDVAAALEADLLVYDWADDAAQHLLTKSERLRTRVAGWEDEMARRAAVVFVSSAELLSRRVTVDERTFLVPHGVAAIHRSPGDAPADVARLPHPRVGFVGHLNEWIDVELLEHLARARPDWSFVFVGPSRVSVRRLGRFPNVLLTGERPHEEVPGVLATCDAGIIPYRPSAAITVASPVKLREYLMHGLPVVSVDIPEVRPFVPPVELAEGTAGFVAALERALARGRTPPEQRPNRDWSDAVDEIIGAIERALKVPGLPEDQVSPGRDGPG